MGFGSGTALPPTPQIPARSTGHCSIKGIAAPLAAYDAYETSPLKVPDVFRKNICHVLVDPVIIFIASFFQGLRLTLEGRGEAVSQGTCSINPLYILTLV